MKMTTILSAAAAAIVLTSGAAMAHPGKGHGGPGYKSGYSQQQIKHHRGAGPAQRAAIARSAANLAALKRRAWRDGRLSMIEKAQIRNAERRHAALVQRVHRFR
ncbi:hypothetical protein W911_15695 [Hyphomicrobium nitrativorans NL23]|uniref:Uncharacterized protein n=1 Tax=Hyphomicrobium nitrativorans NL23 TaxID=1029756 RepID=V5SHQ8_9HYPH|nr:hypothetical protein [Hyphomicrobium nitrativorans]AHB50391.1 hypothetical protein W911_15695 [Hyphomicrobium nitrativorans NL23]